MDDPNFQTPKYKVEDVNEICILATTTYKSTQYPSQVQPMVCNLLAQMDKDEIIKAIKNVSEMFDNSDTPHQYRKDFARQFFSVQAVKEMAAKEVAPVEKKSDWLSS